MSRFRMMDGAMGTFLLQHGASPDPSLILLNEKRPTLIQEIHRSYLLAGADVIITNTFGGNRLALGSLSKRLEKLNRLGVRLARKVSPKKVFAAVGPLGSEARKLTSRVSRQFFREQVRALEKERPDGYLVETMISLNEAEAACQAVREVTDRPLLVSLTFPRGLPREPKRLLALVGSTLREAGADVIGYNCGFHPEETFNFLNLFRLVDPGPWLARPAAGTPARPVAPQEFAKWGVRLAALGVAYLGGCCGSTPSHIRALAERLRLLPVSFRR